MHGLNSNADQPVSPLADLPIAPLAFFADENLYEDGR
jgi:hypothetical protein